MLTWNQCWCKIKGGRAHKLASCPLLGNTSRNHSIGETILYFHSLEWDNNISPVVLYFKTNSSLLPLLKVASPLEGLCLAPCFSARPASPQSFKSWWWNVNQCAHIGGMVLQQGYSKTSNNKRHAWNRYTLNWGWYTMANLSFTSKLSSKYFSIPIIFRMFGTHLQSWDSACHCGLRDTCQPVAYLAILVPLLQKALCGWLAGTSWESPRALQQR